MENIEPEQLPGEIKRRGISARQRLRVIVETLGDASLAEMVEQGGAFAFLHDEPDLYSDADIRRRNV